MSKSNLDKIVSNITAQIEQSYAMRDIVNTYQHVYSLSINDLEVEALYQLKELIDTIDDPSAAEIERRKKQLRKLLERYATDLYNSLLKNPGKLVVVDFKRGSNPLNFTVTVTSTGKSKAKDGYSVFGFINDKRTGKLLKELRDSIHLDLFLAHHSEHLDRAIYGNLYTSKRTGKIVRSSGLFQLGHEKSQSVSLRRKAEILKSLSSKSGAGSILGGTTLTKQELGTISTVVSTYAKGEASDLVKKFRTTVHISDESAYRNQGDSSRERAILNALTKEVSKELLEKTSIFTLKTSSSAVDIVLSQIADTLKKGGAKKVSKTSATSSKTTSSSKIKGTKSVSRSREALGSLNISEAYNPVSTQPNWLSVVNIINSQLEPVMIANMKTPRLQNRTGTLASSAKVVGVETTPEGFPSFIFDYQRNPYDVFDRALGKAPWNTKDRDPKDLVSTSIREIVKELAIGRFYARRA